MHQRFRLIVFGLTLLGAVGAALADDLFVNTFDTGISGIDWQNYRIELARVEAKADLRSEIKMAGGLGVAGICALLTVQMLLVAVAFGLAGAGVLPGWAASLIVAAVVLAIGTGAGLWGWAKRVKQPLGTTRTSLKDGVRWAKEQVA